LFLLKKIWRLLHFKVSKIDELCPLPAGEGEGFGGFYDFYMFQSSSVDSKNKFGMLS
jgi:hypothetical protein